MFTIEGRGVSRALYFGNPFRMHGGGGEREGVI